MGRAEIEFKNSTKRIYRILDYALRERMLLLVLAKDNHEWISLAMINRFNISVLPQEALPVTEKPR